MITLFLFITFFNYFFINYIDYFTIYYLIPYINFIHMCKNDKIKLNVIIEDDTDDKSFLNQITNNMTLYHMLSLIIETNFELNPITNEDLDINDVIPELDVIPENTNENDIKDIISKSDDTEDESSFIKPDTNTTEIHDDSDINSDTVIVENVE